MVSCIKRTLRPIALLLTATVVLPNVSCSTFHRSKSPLQSKEQHTNYLSSKTTDVLNFVKHNTRSSVLEDETKQAKVFLDKTNQRDDDAKTTASVASLSSDETSSSSTTATTLFSVSSSCASERNDEIERFKTLSQAKILAISLLTVLSVTIVGFSPASYLVGQLGADKASSALAMLSTASALLEIVLSPLMGSVLDSVGRKQPLMAIIVSSAIVHGIVATTFRKTTRGNSMGVTAMIVSICAAKLIVSMCRGFHFMITQTIISDIFSDNSNMMDSTSETQSTASTKNALISSHKTNNDNNNNNNNRLSSALGIQMAASGAGFLLGAIGAGQLSEYEISTRYGISSFLLFITFLLIKFGLRETLPTTIAEEASSHRHSGQPPIYRNNGNHNSGKKRNLATLLGLESSPLSSCTKLLWKHGRKVRMLAIILMIQSLPANAGDFFQIFCKTEWSVSTKQFSSFLAVLAVVGILANMLGSFAIQRLGVKTFTSLAIVSSLCPPIGASLWGYPGIVGGFLVGFLSSAQTVGIHGELMSRAQRLGIPQGQLTGERASLLAILKVLGPLLYSLLYVQGQRLFGINYLPFVFNSVLGIVALVISQEALG